ncbi:MULTISPECIES: helix-turn-helix domain-containing protein [unclassified Streptomyces]|uniref:winged helix-turn-helix transcriptional regulator n=1 Tax=unclassified Streptomyces TaxID=2593676 RepID=UPI000399B799|nr:helix-turn-helix domain-containing protein [Streptomyces sp. BoleA5]
MPEFPGRGRTRRTPLDGGDPARGARRFGEYRAVIAGISDRLLTQRLKELEAEGLIARSVIPSTPVQVRYELAPDGQALIAALRPLAQWSARRLRRVG